MTKTDYLARLRESLALMPAEEREAQLAYYEELFDDMLEDGMSEEQVVEHLGAPETVAEELLAEIPMTTLVKNRVKAEGRPSALTVVLLVLGFPLWFPLLVSVFAVVLSLVITLWALVIGFAAVVFSLGVTAIAAPVALVAGGFQGSPLMVAGYALIAAGLCLLGVLALPPLCGAMARLCRAIGRGVKSIFIKKER
jgi:uncharacterized membrane protein